MASPAKESNDCDALLGEESITFDLDDENCHDETMNADLHASDNDEDPSKKSGEVEEFLRVEEELQSSPIVSKEDDFEDGVGDFSMDGEEDESEILSVETQDTSKIARSKKTPSRYDDCMLDLSDITEPISEEALQPSYKKLKSVKFAIEPSTKEDQNYEQLDPSSPAPTSDKEEETNDSTFDPDGNFRFKLGKEHIIKSRTGGLNTYRCDICDMIFPRSFSLRRHYERIHINPRFVRNKGKKDQEMVRKLIESDKKNNLMKMKKDTTEDNEKPDDNKRGGDDAEAESTQREDPSFYVYACKLCSRFQIFFKTKEQLRLHYQTRHTAVARLKSETFKCETCDRTYNTRHELYRHRRIHSGERPYACRYCGKRFPTSTNARRHERTHTGDRPHICKVCGKGFIQKTDMSKHLRTVHRLRFSRKKFERTPDEDNCSLEDNEAYDSSNQFEENIDFAAYLNLDKYEKGTLMGGSEVEARFLNSSPSGAGNLLVGRKNFEKEETSNVKAGGSQQELEEVEYKCPECFKKFNSKVNMRRHYRLKHERNQVKSLFPVSMVVNKYKIKESNEREFKEEITDTLIESNLSNAECNSANTPSPGNSVFKPSARPAANLSVDLPESNSPSPSVLGTKSSQKGGKQQGSKLGQILERLTMKKANEVKSDERPFSDQQRTPPKKENLISSNTLLESMQHAKKKAQQVRQENTVKSSQPFPSMQKTKESGSPDSKFFFGSKSQSLDQIMIDKIRRDDIKMKRAISERKLNSYAKGKLSRNPTSDKMFSSFRSGSSFRQPTYRNSPKSSFMAQDAFRGRRRPFFKDGNEFLKNDSFKDTKLSRFHPSFTPSKNPKRSFLDACWSQKINNIPEHMRNPPENRPWQSPFDLQERFPFERPKVSRPHDHPQLETTFSKKDSPLRFKPQMKQPDSARPGNTAPLDLTKRKKDASSVAFSVNDDGVLDLSTSSRPSPSARAENTDKNKKEDFIPKKDFSSSIVREQGRNMQAIFQPGDQQCSGPLSDPRNMFDAREMKYGSNSSVPLKFHAVKFDKDGQIHSSGTAGRPPKSFSNSGQFRKFPAGIDSVFNESFSRQFMKSFPHPGISARDSMFPHRSRHHPHNFSPYNKHHHRDLRQNAHRGSSPGVSPSDVFRMSDRPSSSTFHHQRLGNRFPYLNPDFPQGSKLGPYSSFLKQPGSDVVRRRSHEHPSMLDAKAGNQGMLHLSNRKIFDEFDEDVVMKRCIRKAQHELTRSGTSGESSRNVFEIPRSSASDESERKIKEESRHDRSSPIPFVMAPQKQANDARNKLTMTPGFDTNGDDSSRDDDVHSLSLGSLFSKTTPNDDEAENPTRSTPLRIPQSRNDIASQVASSRKPNFPLKFKDNTHRSKQIGLDSVVNRLLKPITSMPTSSKSVDVNRGKVAEMTGSEKKNESDLSDGASLEDCDEFVSASKVKTSDVEQSSKLQNEENCSDHSLKSLFAAPKKDSAFQPIKSPASDAGDYPCEPKKFIQKIKLRINREKDGTKKWTLVERESSCDDFSSPISLVNVVDNKDILKDDAKSSSGFALDTAQSFSTKSKNEGSPTFSSRIEKKPSIMTKELESQIGEPLKSELIQASVTVKAMSTSAEKEICAPNLTSKGQSLGQDSVANDSLSSKSRDRSRSLEASSAQASTFCKPVIRVESDKLSQYKETCLISDQTYPSLDASMVSALEKKTVSGENVQENQLAFEHTLTETSLNVKVTTPVKQLPSNDDLNVISAANSRQSENNNTTLSNQNKQENQPTFGYDLTETFLNVKASSPLKKSMSNDDLNEIPATLNETTEQQSETEIDQNSIVKQETLLKTHPNLTEIYRNTKVICPLKQSPIHDDAYQASSLKSGTEKSPLQKDSSASLPMENVLNKSPSECESHTAISNEKESNMAETSLVQATRNEAALISEKCETKKESVYLPLEKEFNVTATFNVSSEAESPISLQKGSAILPIASDLAEQSYLNDSLSSRESISSSRSTDEAKDSVHQLAFVHKSPNFSAGQAETNKDSKETTISLSSKLAFASREILPSTIDETETKVQEVDNEQKLLEEQSLAEPNLDPFRFVQLEARSAAEGIESGSSLTTAQETPDAEVALVHEGVSTLESSDVGQTKESNDVDLESQYQTEKLTDSTEEDISHSLDQPILPQQHSDQEIITYFDDEFCDDVRFAKNDSLNSVKNATKKDSCSVNSNLITADNTEKPEESQSSISTAMTPVSEQVGAPEEAKPIITTVAGCDTIPITSINDLSDVNQSNSNNKSERVLKFPQQTLAIKSSDDLQFSEPEKYSLSTSSPVHTDSVEGEPCTYKPSMSTSNPEESGEEIHPSRLPTDELPLNCPEMHADSPEKSVDLLISSPDHSKSLGIDIGTDSIDTDDAFDSSEPFEESFEGSLASLPQRVRNEKPEAADDASESKEPESLFFADKPSATRPIKFEGSESDEHSNQVDEPKLKKSHVIRKFAKKQKRKKKTKKQRWLKSRNTSNIYKQQLDSHLSDIAAESLEAASVIKAKPAAAGVSDPASVVKSKDAPETVDMLPFSDNTSPQNIKATINKTSEVVSFGTDFQREAPAKSKEMSDTFQTKTKLVGRPRGRPKLSSSQRGRPKLTSAPRGRPKLPKLVSAPRGRPKLTSAQRGRPKLNSAPRGRPKLTSAPRGRPRLTTAPRGRPKLNLQPQERSDVPTVPPKLTSAPRGRPKSTSRPRGRPRLTPAPPKLPQESIASAQEAFTSSKSPSTKIVNETFQAASLNEANFAPEMIDETLSSDTNFRTANDLTAETIFLTKNRAEAHVYDPENVRLTTDQTNEAKSSECVSATEPFASGSEVHSPETTFKTKTKLVGRPRGRPKLNSRPPGRPKLSGPGRPKLSGPPKLISAPRGRPKLTSRPPGRPKLSSASPELPKLTSAPSGKPRLPSPQTGLPKLTSRPPGRPRKIKRYFPKKKLPTAEPRLMDELNPLGNVSEAAEFDKYSFKESESVVGDIVVSAGASSTIEFMTSGQSPALGPRGKRKHEDFESLKWMSKSKKKAMLGSDAKFQHLKTNKRVKTRSFEAPYKSAAEMVKTKSAGRGRKPSKQSEQVDAQSESDTAALESSSQPETKPSTNLNKLKRSLASIKNQTKPKKSRKTSNIMPVRRSIRNFTRSEITKPKK